MLNNQGHLVIFQVGVQSWMIDLLLSVWSCLMQHTVCSNVFLYHFISFSMLCLRPGASFMK